MDISTVLTALIDVLKGFDPLVFLSVLAMAALGFVWVTDRRSYEAQLKTLRDEFAAMVAQKDARYDALTASTQTALSEAHTQLAALNKDYSTANKDTAEIVNQVAQTLATLADTLKDRHEEGRMRRG